MSQNLKTDNQADNKGGFQHYNSFEENIKRPGAMGEPGDQIIASIEAPLDHQKSSLSKKKGDNSFVQNKSFDERHENQRQRSGYEDIDNQRRKSSVLDPEHKGYQKENSRVLSNEVRQIQRARDNRQPNQQASRNQASSAVEQRTFCQKCPSWLKTLLILIALIALGGLAYWFFFKRGKVTPLKKHKGEGKEKAKEIKQQIVTTVTQPVKTVQSPPIEVAPGVLNPPVIINSNQKSEANSSSTVVKSTQNDASQAQALVQKSKNENQTLTQKQSPKPEQSSLNSNTTQDSTIVIPKGNKQFCSDSQFLLNGNCVRCPPGLTWSGLNCVSKKIGKHLKRSHYNN